MQPEKRPEPFHASIVIPDIESFGKRPDAVQGDLRKSLYQVMGNAIGQCRTLSAEEVSIEDRGDSVIMVFRQASPVTLLGPFVRELDIELRSRAKAHTAMYAMRLRMSIHNGLIWRDRNGWVGTAINTAARLVDEDELRKALAEAPEAQLAVIISNDLHQDVVLQEHPGIEAAAYRPVRVVAKEVDTTAWIWVPGGTVPVGQIDLPGPDGTGPSTSIQESLNRISDSTIHGNVAGRDVRYYGTGGGR